MTSIGVSEKKRQVTLPSRKRAVPSRRRKSSARGAKQHLGYSSLIQGVSGSPWKAAGTWAMAGQEDTELVKMRYETTSAFTATSGAASYLQIKGNSIYRPYPGNTDSPAGYQRLYTQYQLAVTLASRIEVRIWSDTGAGVQQPFRMACVPCTPAAYTIYSAYSNVASLRGVPHATEALFSPGASMPVLRGKASNATILNGNPFESGVEVSAGSSGFQAGTGADPSAIWYYLIGLQAMAGTTTLNAQIQVMIEYDVMFYRPIGTAVQQLNRWGNEETPPVEEKFEEKKKLEHDLKSRLERVEAKLARAPQQSAADDFELVQVPFARSQPPASAAVQRSPGAPVAPGSVGGIGYRSPG